MPGKNALFAIGSIIVFFMAWTGYMAWEGESCQITSLSIDGAPGNIVYIADPHLRPENLEHVELVISEINRLHPSVVLIGGDFVYGEDDDLSLQQVWKKIEAPVYAILGNHDYRAGIKGCGLFGRLSWLTEIYMRGHDRDAGFLYAGCDRKLADSIEEELEKNNVTVLRNEYVECTIDGRDVIIVGLDDLWAGMADPPAVPDTGAYTIFLVHEPMRSRDWDADLVLAGHTHGGQFNLGGMQVLQIAGIAEISGFSVKNNIPMYISRGIGTSNLDSNYRYCAPPEIVVINPEKTD
jgi:predicted MPP superfamily phosphohydrolase